MSRVTPRLRSTPNVVALHQMLETLLPPGARSARIEPPEGEPRFFCGHCDAYQTIRLTGYGAHISTHHDDDCPALRRQVAS